MIQTEPEICNKTNKQTKKNNKKTHETAAMHLRS